MGLHIKRTWRPVINITATSFLVLGFVGSVSLASTLTPHIAEAATPPDSCFAFDSGTGTINSYFTNENSDPGQPACPLSVDIPSTIGGVNVTNIQFAAFAGRSLTAVTFPNTLVTIGDAAFVSNNLTNVTLPASLTTIGSSAFNGNSLTSFSVPNSVTSIGSNVIGGNPVTSLTIGTSDFSGTPQLQLVNNEFASLGQLTTVTLGANVLSIDNQAFAYNSSLTDLTLSPSLTSIGVRAFYDSGLTSLSLPSSVTTIGDYAFLNSDIVMLDLSHVQSIGDYAFLGNKIVDLVIPNSVTSFGGNMVFTSNPLTSVTIGTADFSGTPTLTLPDGMFNGGLFTTGGLTELSIGANVLSIGGSTFMNNTLTDITIPASVTSIGSYAFLNNDIQTVTIEGNPTLADFGAPHSDISTVFWENGYTHADMPTGLDPDQEAAYKQANVNYLRVYANDPAFIAAHAPIFTYTQTPTTTTYVTFGYILNPATYAVSYQSSANATLAPTVTSGTGPSLTTYRLGDNTTGDISLYYRAGNSISLTALAINGYPTPAPYQLILTAGSNPHTFVYTAAQTSSSTTTDTSTGGSTAQTPSSTSTTLSSTGTSQFIFAGSVLLLLISGIGYMVVKRQRS